MLKVFVDTVAWIALFNSSDGLHTPAQQVMNDLRQQNVQLVTTLYERIDDLDRLLRAERSTFLMVLGQEELRPARRGQGSPRAHWWWYLDELQAPPEPVQKHRERLAQTFTAARREAAEPRAGRGG